MTLPLSSCLPPLPPPSIIPHPSLCSRLTYHFCGHLYQLRVWDRASVDLPQHRQKVPAAHKPVAVAIVDSEHQPHSVLLCPAPREQLRGRREDFRDTAYQHPWLYLGSLTGKTRGGGKRHHS